MIQVNRLTMEEAELMVDAALATAMIFQTD